MQLPLAINTGEYVFELQKAVPSVLSSMQLIYGDCESASPADFVLSIKPSSILRSVVRKSVGFYCDQFTPFKPLPASQAYPLLEWGMNWCIAAHDFNHLIVHAAVLVKNNQAILFPALPGSGKSTLTTCLGLSGWKVYSDEMAIIDLHTLEVKPLYRPACIKNQSISLINQWFPDAIMTPVCHDTSKGSVAHVKLTDWSAFKTYKPVPIAGLVFPKYQVDSELTILELDQLQGFQAFCTHSFNYHVLGEQGFDAVSRLIGSLRLFEASYNDLGFMNEFLEAEVLG